MRYCKILLCALLCFSFCLSVCSASVNATEVEVPEYIVYAVASSYASGQLDSAVIYMNDGNATLVRTSDTATVNSLYTLYCTMNFGTTSGDLIVGSGNDTKVTIQNMYTRMSAVISGTTIDLTASIDYSAHLIYMDGTAEYDVQTEVVDNSGGLVDLTLSFTPTEEVEKIVVTAYVKFNDTSLVDLYNGKSVTSYITFGEETADKHYQLSIEQQSEEAGLLSTIITYVKEIWQNIKDLPDKLTDIWDSIIELPSKIWGFFEEGLTNLFVPDQEYIIAYETKWKELLAEKLGAVWQVIDVTYGAWEEIGSADENNTINMPSVTIPLPDDNEFTFGGYEVAIVPEGFEALATAVKLISGIASTFLFINGLRKRYDEVMGVEM